MKETTCIHQKLCKHFQEDELSDCGIREVCKFFVQSFLGGGVDFEGRKIDPVAKKKKAESSEDAMLKTFRKAKVYIALHRQMLDENQKKAVESTSGKHYSGLTKEQKEQVISIAADLERMRKG